jgi:hypothetical protein
VGRLIDNLATATLKCKVEGPRRASHLGDKVFVKESFLRFKQSDFLDLEFFYSLGAFDDILSLEAIAIALDDHRTEWYFTPMGTRVG